MPDSWASRKDFNMAKKAKRPPGFRAFDSLARKLSRVPKEDVEAAIEADRTKRKAKRVKKK